MVSRARALALAACLGPLAWGAAPAAAQEARAWLDPETIALGQTADLTVEVELSRVFDGRVEEPRLPEIEGARIVGRSRESRVTMAGASIARTTVYRYTLLPTMPGVLRIEPIRVIAGDRTLTTAPIRLLVVPSGESLARLDREADPREGPPPIFAVARVDRARAWVGEQVTLTFAFYHDPSYPLAESPDYDPPDTPGFWRMEIDKEPLVSLERVGGRAYHVQRFRYALFPLRAGELTVGSAEVRIVEPDRQRWWEPGGGRTIATDPLRIRVDPLPEAPAGFGGAVGRFELEGELRPSVTPAGTPVELELRVRGTGNPNAVGAPVLPGWPDVAVRPPSAVARVEPGERVRGEKTFRFLLVPESPGRLSLGAARLPYFDPAAGAYRVDTLRLGEIVVTAAPGAGAVAAGSEPARGPTLWPARPPLLRRRDAGRGLAAQPWTWAALAGPWAAWLLAVGARSVARRRPRNAAADAIARLEEASARLASEGTVALGEAERALDDALRARYGAGAAAAVPRERERALAAAGAPAGLVAAVEAARAAVAAARFAAARGASAVVEPAADAARALERVARLLGAPRDREPAGPSGPRAALLLGAAVVVALGGAAATRGQAPAAPPFAATPAEARAAWQTANDAYRAGDFAAAARLYPLLLSTWADPHLEADLGAALWRGGRPGAAYAHFLHALALEPRAGTVRADAARLRAELGAPPDARAPAARLLGYVTLDELLAALLALDAIAFALFLVGRRARRVRPFAVAAMALLVVGAGATALHAVTVGRPAWAVVAERAPILAAPGLGAEEAPPIGWLPPGSVVRALDSGPGDWRVRAPGHPAGWVARDRIVPLHSRGPHAD